MDLLDNVRCGSLDGFHNALRLVNYRNGFVRLLLLNLGRRFHVWFTESALALAFGLGGWLRFGRTLGRETGRDVFGALNLARVARAVIKLVLRGFLANRIRAGLK